MSGICFLTTRTVAKPWGRDSLPPPFAAPTRERVGEIWFEPPAALDALLVKYLFTSENLSVQVHPSDSQAPAGCRGKDECWLVIDADPGAKLAIGFKETLDTAAMRAAAIDGSIEHMLSWRTVDAGDFFYLPAGTVHAIGAGLTLVEIQQNSNVTYRLYDYGRPRELHLDEAVAVARGERYADARARSVTGSGALTLVDGPHFRLDRLCGTACCRVADRYAGAPLLVLPLDGQVWVAGEAVVPGECAMAQDIREIEIAASGLTLITQPVCESKAQAITAA
jgi:mannose-6-phosphate isomerase